jgi:methylated-DNA-[protein]-cysteine S-methyltransferase
MDPVANRCHAATLHAQALHHGVLRRRPPYTRDVSAPRRLQHQTSVYRLVPAPWGPIHIAATDAGLVALELLSSTEAFVARLERRLGVAPEPANAGARDAGAGSARELLATAAGELARYLDGSARGIELPVDLTGLADWDRRVLGAVRSVPYGRVTSYGRVARMVGSPGAARAVGGAVGRNPVGLVIPCHRIIAGDGSLGGYGGEWAGDRQQLLDIKAELLAREGVSMPAATLFGP